METIKFFSEEFEKWLIPYTPYTIKVSFVRILIETNIVIKSSHFCE